MKTNLLPPLGALLFLLFSCKKEPITTSPSQPCTQVPRAQFSLEMNSPCPAPCRVKFNNLSENGSSFRWDFGDGYSGLTTISPEHLFRRPGSFEVQLVASKSGCPDDTSTLTLQVDTMRFAKQYPQLPGVATAVELPDGAYLVQHMGAGGTFSGVSADGSVNWSVHSEFSSIERFFSISSAPDGTYALTGRGMAETGYSRPFVRFVDERGFEQRTVALPTAYQGTISEIQFTQDGGFLAIGSRPGNHTIASFMFLLKVNREGEIEQEYLLGDSPSSVGFSLRKTADGGFIACAATVQYNPGIVDPLSIVLIRLNSQGTILWERSIAEGNGWIAEAAEETTDGGFLLVGGIGNLTGFSRKALIIKTDANGNILTAQESSPYAHIQYRDLRRTQDGGHILVGTAGFDNFVSIFGAHLTKLDANGQKEWTTSHQFQGQQFFARSVICTADGGYLITGGRMESYPGITNFSSNRTFLVKTDALGQSQ